jgi:hypothetical protein
MIRNTTTSRRSVVENLEDRRLFAAFAGVDLNGDGMVTGDDFTVIDAGAVTGQQAEVGYKLIERAITTDEPGWDNPAGRPGIDSTLSPSVSGADFNGDGLITGDDYTILDSNDPFSMEATQGYKMLDRVLA